MEDMAPERSTTKKSWQNDSFLCEIDLEFQTFGHPTIQQPTCAICERRCIRTKPVFTAVAKSAYVLKFTVIKIRAKIA
jgi:hypothetical protein